MSLTDHRILGLGIDTGGTFTDAAIVDMGTMKVLATWKSPTTYSDLSIGMLGAVDGVLSSALFTVDEIKLVGLSTTLATNSILTGKGGSVGLICIGWVPDPDCDLGISMVHSVAGGHTVSGRERVPLNLFQLEHAIDLMVGKVDVIVVSSIFSVHNPEHEERARRMILERTDQLVVAGHDLTSELGIKERTMTAILNAKLIPIIGEFLTGVEASIRKRNINGQIMIYKGDGSMMSIAVARERPVETILSGPAASLMGGRLLSGLDNCIVLDIGGTSTDIAYLDKGFPRITREGATVGNWRTRVRAIDIWTSGLGGDSDVQMDGHGRIEIGPERVTPLAVASKRNPYVLEKIKTTRQTTFYTGYERDTKGLSQEDALVYDYIRTFGLCTLYELDDALKDRTYVIENLRSLKAKGFISQTGLTPTDIMHVKGSYVSGDVAAAREGIEIFANRLGVTVEHFLDIFMEEMVTRVGAEIIKKLIYDEAGEMTNSRSLDYMIRASLGAAGFRTMSIHAALDRPIVGIGAPAHIFVPELEKRLDVKVVIPPHADVGNAVGAVCSKVSESVTLQVYPRGSHYWIFSSLADPEKFDNQDDAIVRAKEMASTYVRERAIMAGARDVKVMVETDERSSSPSPAMLKHSSNWVQVCARASGDPV
jgi:N-methylhydantoinase A/oxoprolinase/acetone carboxylase beta subunit